MTWAREKAGLTKRALAWTVGISEQLLGEIESGWRSATPSNLARIARALNCPVVLLERRRCKAAPINGDGNATAERTLEMDVRSRQAGSDASECHCGPSLLGPEGSVRGVRRGVGGAN
nr:helix-turn-helix transcriptional regulator [Streptomyces sp. NBC_00899]